VFFGLDQYPFSPRISGGSLITSPGLALSLTTLAVRARWRCGYEKPWQELCDRPAQSNEGEALMISIRNVVVVSTALLCLALDAGTASAQTTPQQVQRSLGDLNRVVDHTQRLITSQKFDQLSRENDEFQKGSQALEKSIATEPSDFKMKIAAMLEKAKAESKHLADAAQTPDGATLARIHTSLADAVKEILAAFPNSAHPSSPNLAEEQQEERSATTGSAR
jgi:hypothetical protein